MNVHVLERATRHKRVVEGSPDSNVRRFPTLSPRRLDRPSPVASLDWH